MTIRGASDLDPQLLLRQAVASIDGELSRLSSFQTTEADPERMKALLASWAELMKVLHLEAAPDLRVCPVCANVVMNASTRCGYCWTKLSPAAAPAA